ncbi:hypothetical protein BDN70DRAFT_928375 [Pholiota conissans]|uniref:Glycosyltransferase 61 catalytic domain-containing protein n=1 Tax=Pholiota conissans TaxID=109636 RepID=A0A9P5ZBQ4_9AGAR|nr:hypothetical protein BDN70DRAFT_928375 [Pholiota conissans]
MFFGARGHRDGVFFLTGASVLCIISTLYLGLSFSGLRITNPNIHISETGISSMGIATKSSDESVLDAIPETILIAHAPGWTLFQNLYMSNGTLYIVASESRQAEIPPIRMMTSTGIEADTTPENIAMREPTPQEMQIITPQLARLKWGSSVEDGELNRIWTVEGITLLVNEPRQFLAHYYHFVAELLFGAWSFLYGAFNPYSQLSHTPSMISANNSSSLANQAQQEYNPPSFSRFIFMHASSEGWRDSPGFNSYFVRAAFPSLSIEESDDWADRVAATSDKAMGPRSKDRAWHFPVVLLSDRSAAFRGEACGQRTHRIAAESWEAMVDSAGIDLSGRWWDSVRENILEFAGVAMHTRDGVGRVARISGAQSLLSKPEQITITYLVRQGERRRLIQEDHDGLVQALKEMVERKKAQDGQEWNLRIVEPETLSKDDQVDLASKTTILLGVHGNGLTHLVLMKPNRWSSVIEIFYPGGFAHDYEWTARALGMRHYTIWNDTYLTYPNEPAVVYPEGFQGTDIPVHGKAVAKLIEDRLEDTLL